MNAAANLSSGYQFLKQHTFLSKIQNRISEKTGRKIVLLSYKNSVKTQFLGVVVFPSIFWVQKFCQNTIFGSSGFSFHFLSSKFQGSGFSFQFLISKFQGSGFSFQLLKIWQFFRVILNFAQECYYLKNKVGVVDFTKAHKTIHFILKKSNPCNPNVLIIGGCFWQREINVT